ncbi:hypothetical protein HDU96_009240 [Phlyctochytrium bullatum]|nr:hypothetical protein HDU96_009240 [Phlyctochytrium bullatum]
MSVTRRPLSDISLTAASDIANELNMSKTELPHYLLSNFVPEKATIAQLKSILAECAVDVNLNSRALKEDYVRLFKEKVAKNAAEISKKLFAVKPSSEGIICVDTASIAVSVGPMGADDENTENIAPSEDGQSTENVPRRQLPKGIVKDRASMLRQPTAANSSKELTPSMAALKRRGVQEDSRVEVLVKQYNPADAKNSSKPGPVANLAAIFEGVAANAAQKRARPATDDAENQKAAGLPSGLFKPTKIYRPSTLKSSFADNGGPLSGEQSKKPDFVVPRASPPFVSSTGLTMPLSLIERNDKRKGTPSPPGRNAKKSPNGGLRSGPRRVLVPASAREVTMLPVSTKPPSATRIKREDVPPADEGQAILEPVDNNAHIPFGEVSAKADFSFTMTTKEEDLDDLAPAAEDDDSQFESLFPTRRASLKVAPLFEDPYKASQATTPIGDLNLATPEVPSVSSERLVAENDTSPDSMHSPLRAYSTRAASRERKDSASKPMGSPLLTRTLKQQLEMNLRKGIASPQGLPRSPAISPKKIKELLKRKSEVKTSPTKRALEAAARGEEKVPFERRAISKPSLSTLQKKESFFGVGLLVPLLITLGVGLILFIFDGKVGEIDAQDDVTVLKLAARAAIEDALDIALRNFLHGVEMFETVLAVTAEKAEAMGIDPSILFFIASVSLFVFCGSSFIYIFRLLFFSSEEPGPVDVNHLANQILDTLHQVSRKSKHGDGFVNMDSLAEELLPIYQLPSSSITALDIVLAYIGNRNAADVSRDRIWRKACKTVRLMAGSALNEQSTDSEALEWGLDPEAELESL